MNQVLRIGKSIRKIFEIKPLEMNDLGFDIIMGGNDYEFIGKTNVDNK